ncbi:hypothetical protein CQA44_10240 [Helicobacter sp. MIT 14-3879]|nr:hypothetical protein CQA44_10240 [Helicobacter sp. MIT 14-3879]
MKKLLLIAILSACITTSINAKAFVGIDVGADIGQFESATKDTPSVKSSSIFRGNNERHIYAGIHFGTQHFANDYLGLRWLVGVGYTSAFQTAEINLAIDFLSNFVKIDDRAFGFYLGLGSRFQALVNPRLYGEIPINARVGLSFDIDTYQRIELGAQITLFSWSIKALSGENGAIYAPLQVALSYKVKL